MSLDDRWKQAMDDLHAARIAADAAWAAWEATREAATYEAAQEKPE